MGRTSQRTRVLPGFGLTLGVTLLWLSLIVLLPLSALVVRAAAHGGSGFVETITSARVLASFRLTIGAALSAAAVDAVFGFVIAWTLARYTFPFRRVVDALVDLPFALPTAVSGIALTALYSPTGWIGRWLEPLGVQVAFTPAGVAVALTFIGLPFVVRTLQPAIADLEPEIEEASASLGASRMQTFRRVLVPALLPALLTGFALAFARGLGEYGSVIFIAGNMPMETEITSLLILTKLEQYDYGGAAAIAVGMLVLSLGCLLAINAIQAWSSRRAGERA